MSLSLTQALEAAKNPPNAQQVQKGKEYQSQLRVLTVPHDSETIDNEIAWRQIKDYLKHTLTKEKYEALLNYITFPLESVSLSKDILTDLCKVFNGKNAYFEIDYENRRFKEEAEQTIKDMDFGAWLEETGKGVLKNSPNTVIVVDLDEQGEPKLLTIKDGQLLGYTFDKDGQFTTIVFLHSVGNDVIGDYKRVAVYDDENYRVYEVRNNVYTLVVDELHYIGYCPAHFYFNSPLLNKAAFNRNAPISYVRGTMLKYQIFAWFIYYAEHYGVFPVVEYADSGCDEEGCDNGIIKGSAILGEDNTIVGYRSDSECKTCANKKLIAPGTSIGITVSEDKEDQDTRGVLRFVIPETKSLEYANDVQAKRVNTIKVNTVGYNNVISKEAVNEQQIRALQESKLAALYDVKQPIEEFAKWCVKTCLKAKYQTESVSVDVGVSYSLGTEFFVLSESDIYMLIEAAKKAGTQATQIAELNYMLCYTKYKNNPSKAQYMRISSDLQPSAFDTRQEVLDKYNSGMITNEDYYLYLNFTDLLNRFERENGSIVDFGSELDYSAKIERIRTTLDFYIQQKRQINERENDSSQQAEGSPARD